MARNWLYGTQFHKASLIKQTIYNVLCPWWLIWLNDNNWRRSNIWWINTFHDLLPLVRRRSLLCYRSYRTGQMAVILHQSIPRKDTQFLQQVRTTKNPTRLTRWPKYVTNLEKNHWQLMNMLLRWKKGTPPPPPQNPFVSPIPAL